MIQIVMLGKKVGFLKGFIQGFIKGFIIGFLKASRRDVT